MIRFMFFKDGIENHVERAANEVSSGRNELGMAVRYKVRVIYPLICIWFIHMCSTPPPLEMQPSFNSYNNSRCTWSNSSHCYRVCYLCVWSGTCLQQQEVIIYKLNYSKAVCLFSFK